MQTPLLDIKWFSFILEALEELPLAPAPPPRQLSEKEKDKLFVAEEAVQRELRIFLREVLQKLIRNRQYVISMYLLLNTYFLS